MAGTWTKITVTVETGAIERTASIISMLDNGLMIEDFSDFSLNGMYGELVDESILSADTAHGKISIFVPEEKTPEEYVGYIREKLGREKIPYSLDIECMKEDNWQDGWKKYFEPIKLGRVTVVPTWQDYEAKDDEVVVRIDPGMAFGTGSHETTRLVMRLMQDELSGGECVLDVGCGSGILSILASKLGAGSVNAYDIDPVAVRVAKENARASGITNIKVGVSDLLLGVERTEGGYDVCVANIVAEIIIRMLPDVGAYLKPEAPIILSGIVNDKRDEVIRCAEANGYKLIREITENDWVALLIKRS